MFRRCYIHIGMPRTGSTAIQASLALNRDALAELGRHVPLIDGAIDHAALAVYAREATAQDELHARFVGDGHADPAAFEAKIQGWADALAADGGADRDVVLSTEHLYEQVTTQAGWDRLATLVRGFARAITVIVYLRRQDRVAISIAGAAVRAGAGLEIPLLPDLSEELPYIFSYSSVIRTLRTVFTGADDAVVVRPIEEHATRDMDIVREFHRIIEIPDTAQLTGVGRVNESLSFPAQMFLARFNGHVPLLVDGAINEVRGNVSDLVAQFPGPRRLPTRARAKRFVARFADDNAQTLELLGSALDRPQLFDNDFSDYPESALNHTLTVQQAIKIASRLWEHQAAEIARLKAELARHTATS